MSKAKPKTSKSTKGDSSLDAKPVAELDETDAAAELARLAADIAHHDELYYRDDEPEISDAAYDALRARNDEIEARFPHLIRDDSPSLRVGAAPVGAFGKVAASRADAVDRQRFHRGQGRCISRQRQGVSRTCARNKPLEVTAEPKIDGLSITLRYERGRLIQGATRGDGYEGERRHRQCANHRRHSQSRSAKDFPAAFEVRGEIYMRHADFQTP